MTNTSGIHTGLVTHHHDQVATIPVAVNLRVKKIKNNIELSPVPDELVEFELFAISFYLYLKICISFEFTNTIVFESFQSSIRTQHSIHTTHRVGCLHKS
jgi:hypothetical protein